MSNDYITAFPNIERLLQLHQEVVIIYVVDGFEARFYKNDNWNVLVKGEVKPTVFQAMQSLDNQLEEIKEI